MGRKSSVTQLEPDLREAVDAAIREGRATLDEIVTMVRGMGGEVSRSALGRYKLTFERGMEVYKASQEMAKVWTQRLEEDPESDVARLAAQVLSGVALNTAQSLINADEAVPAGELHFLAKALDHLGRFSKNTTENILRIRKEVAAQAADKVQETGRKLGLSPEALETIRREVYGIAT